MEAFHCPVRDGKEWFRPAMASGLKTGQFGIIFSSFVTLFFTFEPLIFLLRFRPTSHSGHKQHGYRIKPHEQLVSVSSTPHSAYTPDLSTSSSRTTLEGGLTSGKTHLQASFPLRCFQRLSLPHLATRQCHWRDNRYTRGASTPVLSY